LIDSGGKAVASCGWSHFTDKPNTEPVCPQPVWNISDPVAWMQTSLTGGGMMQTACWLMPRSICEAAGEWDQSLSLHDDGEYFTRLLLKSERQIFISDCYVYYRKVKNSLSRRRSDKAVESAFRVCELRSRHILEADGSSETRRALATLYAQFAYEFSSDAADLAAIANRRIVELSESPANCIGGEWFRRLCRAVGWQNAIRLRTCLRSLAMRR
jgi:hypothetical protein